MTLVLTSLSCGIYRTTVMKLLVDKASVPAGGPFTVLFGVGKTDDNGNAMFQSYLSKLFKKETG